MRCDRVVLPLPLPPRVAPSPTPPVLKRSAPLRKCIERPESLFFAFGEPARTTRRLLHRDRRATTHPDAKASRNASSSRASRRRDAARRSGDALAARRATTRDDATRVVAASARCAIAPREEEEEEEEDGRRERGRARGVVK